MTHTLFTSRRGGDSGFKRVNQLVWLFLRPSVQIIVRGITSKENVEFETDRCIWPRVHKETENEDQAQDQIDKLP